MPEDISDTFLFLLSRPQGRCSFVLHSVILLPLPPTAVLPLSLLVHGDVHAWPLQQLLLRLPSSGHRHGRQDLKDHPVFCHPQWQTGQLGYEGEESSAP